MENAENTLVQVDFTSPEGRKERLWAESSGIGQARILSVPVWNYGLSVGTVVDLTAVPPRIIGISKGATLRFLASEGSSGKAVYLSRVLIDLQKLGYGAGPATFFGPRLVAMNVHIRSDWWPGIGTYLGQLVAQGVVEQWEAADPDQGANDDDEPTTETIANKVLVHPLPVPGSLSIEFS